MADYAAGGMNTEGDDGNGTTTTTTTTHVAKCVALAEGTTIRVAPMERSRGGWDEEHFHEHLRLPEESNVGKGMVVMLEGELLCSGIMELFIVMIVLLESQRDLVCNRCDVEYPAVSCGNYGVISPPSDFGCEKGWGNPYLFITLLPILSNTTSLDFTLHTNSPPKPHSHRTRMPRHRPLPLPLLRSRQNIRRPLWSQRQSPNRPPTSRQLQRSSRCFLPQSSMRRKQLGSLLDCIAGWKVECGGGEGAGEELHRDVG